MGSRNAPSSTRVDLALGGRLMRRLQRYAHQNGVTPEEVLIQSVKAFLDRYPLREQRESTDSAGGSASPARD